MKSKARRQTSDPIRRTKLLVVVLAAWTLIGCGFLQPQQDPTRFYVLTASSKDRGETDVGLTQWKVGILPVEGPAYLRSKAMVIRTGHNEILFADYHRWAEPLDQGIARVLKEMLSSKGNIESVVLNPRGDDTLDYEVAIQISAFEGVRKGDGNNTAQLIATWEVRSTNKGGQIHRGVFEANRSVWNGDDYGQLAARLSMALAALSKEIAADLPVETTPP